MDKIVLPEFGVHLSDRARLYKFNELLSAPLPRAETTEHILRIAAHVEEQGYLIVGLSQRPLRLRAPKAGEKGIVVAETTDQPVSYNRLCTFMRKTMRLQENQTRSSGSAVPIIRS